MGHEGVIRQRPGALVGLVLLSHHLEAGRSLETSLAMIEGVAG